MKLREHRKRKYLTQRELAEKAGISDWIISKVESRGRQPRVTTMRWIAQALGVQPQDIEEFEFRN